MAVSSKNTKSMARKNRQVRLKQKMIMTTIGCSAVFAGLGNNLQQCDAFSFPSTNTRSLVYSTGGVSRVWFRDGDDEDSEHRRRDHNRALSLMSSVRVTAQKWRINSIIQQRDEVPKEQQNIDEYLEFLDRRYNRLHSNDKKEVRKRSVNTAWKWIFDSDSSISKPTSLRESMKQDALYVLGVAELASARLLQKHPSSLEKPARKGELPKSLALTHDNTVIDSRLVEDDKRLSSSNTNRALQVNFLIATKFLLEIDARRSAFLKGQLSNLKRLMASSSRVILFRLLVLCRARASLMKRRIQATSVLAFSLLTLWVVKPLKDLTMKSVCS